MSLKLGLYRNKHKLCCSEICENLPSHSQSENNLKNKLLDKLLQPQLSQALLEREPILKQIYSSTCERCREQTARSHAYRNRFKLGHDLEIGHKVLYENYKQDLTRSQKRQQRRFEFFTVTKRITDTIYQAQDDKDPTIIKTLHRNHLVEYYPKEGSLPTMIEENVPPNHQNDNFYERFMEQRARGLNNPSTTEDHDSLPFLLEPLRSISSTNKPKRSSMHSNDSGITSPLAFSRTPVLSPEITTEKSTPYPSSSQHAQTAQLSPGNISVQFNDLFVTVQLAWLEIALKRALKSPNTTAHSRTIPIYNQYCEPALDRAINFDPLHTITTFYNFSVTCTIIFYSELLLLFDSRLH